MTRLNCIVVYSPDREQLLFCRRRKDPYKGLYNFVGGHVEEGETGEEAAYRELQEETGITSDDIRLEHLMDLTYYRQDFVIEIYGGQLFHEVVLQEELNPLVWLDRREDFCDMTRFAGEQNIGHIVNVAAKMPTL